MTVDAHHHFWHLRRGDYAFPAPHDAVLYRDFMPEDLRAALRELDIEQTVLVQATDTLNESRFLLDIAGQAWFVGGVVGWWDARTPALLDALLMTPNSAMLVGVRPMLQRHEDVGWLAHPETLRNMRPIVDRALVLDALVDVRHLDALQALCSGLPELKIVIDHMGKPWRFAEKFDAWEAGMQKLAAHRNCWVKISGFPFAAPQPSPLCLDRLVEQLRAWFTADRLVWGSDWPVVEREGGYILAHDAVARLFSEAEASRVFSTNAVALYGLKH